MDMFSTLTIKIDEFLSKTHGVYILVFVIVILAFVLRVQALIHYGWPDYMPWATRVFYGGITGGYWAFATDLLETGEYAYLGYPPAYPLFIAIVRLVFGDDMTSVRAVQACLDAAAVIPLFYVFRRIGISPFFSLLGILLYAVHVSFIFGSVTILGEALTPALYVVELALLLRLVGGPSATAAAILGLIIGVHALIRPDHALFVILAPAVLVLRLRSAGLRRALVVFAVGACVVGAWGAHNRIKHDAWVFTSTSAGSTLWSGLGSLPNEYGYRLDDAHWGNYVRTRGMDWHSIEADAHFRSLFLDAVREHPGYYLHTVVRRMGRIISRFDSPRPRGIGHPILQLFGNAGILLLLWACWLKRGEPTLALILALPLLYALLSLGPVHQETRYTRYVHLSYIGALFVVLEYVSMRLQEDRRRLAAVMRIGLLLSTLLISVYSTLAWGRLALESLSGARPTEDAG